MTSRKVTAIALLATLYTLAGGLAYGIGYVLLSHGFGKLLSVITLLYLVLTTRVKYPGKHGLDIRFGFQQDEDSQ